MPTDDDGNWQPVEPHHYIIREGKPSRVEGYNVPIKCPGSFQAFRLAWPRADGDIETVWWHLEVWQPSAAVVDYLNRHGWKPHEPHANDRPQNAVCWLTADVDIARGILPDKEWDDHTPILRTSDPF
jgi:hypothetical protein